MCLSYCHRRNVLWWNHASCRAADCAWAAGNFPEHWRCVSCPHRQGEQCGLTGMALPVRGGCCHFGVTRVHGQVVVPGRALNYVWRDGLAAELGWAGVNYEMDAAEGTVQLDVDELAAPFIYGEGTEEDEPVGVEAGRPASGQTGTAWWD